MSHAPAAGAGVTKVPGMRRDSNGNPIYSVFMQPAVRPSVTSTDSMQHSIVQLFSIASKVARSLISMIFYCETSRSNLKADSLITFLVILELICSITSRRILSFIMVFIVKELKYSASST